MLLWACLWRVPLVSGKADIDLGSPCDLVVKVPDFVIAVYYSVISPPCLVKVRAPLSALSDKPSSACGFSRWFVSENCCFPSPTERPTSYHIC